MTKDLSKVPYSATSVYLAIIPDIEKVKTEDIGSDEKMEKVRDIITKALCKARTTCGSKNNRYEIGQDYIIRVRTIIARHKTVDQTLTYLRNAIEKGKNYETKENKYYD